MANTTTMNDAWWNNEQRVTKMDDEWRTAIDLGHDDDDENGTDKDNDNDNNIMFIPIKIRRSI